MQRKALEAGWTLALALSVPGALAQTRPVGIGLCANWEQNLARSANVGWSRIDVDWSQVNPAPGVWDFSVMDSQIGFANAQGQQILGILHLVPQWLVPCCNKNTPPRSTVEWAEFVRRTAQRYRGKIQAYEVWNEPDLKSSSTPGIGWQRNIEEPPLYVDFVRAAAVEIRAQAPGTLVVGPAFLSNNNASGSDNRKKRILQQLRDRSYPDGAGHTFVDVVSVHNNARDTEPSRSMGSQLRNANLAYLDNHCPPLRNRPVWVTEYGWRSNAVGESGQREKICNLTKIYTGRLEPGTGVRLYDVRRGFIYVQKADGTSASLFRGNNTPKPAVTQYVQRLAYPAVQAPALSAEFPSCSGVGLNGGSLDEETLAAALAELGVGDPSAAVPAGFSRASVALEGTPASVAFLFEDEANGWISVAVSWAGKEAPPAPFLTDAGAAWTSGKAAVTVSGMRDGSPLGKAAVRAIASALDMGFDGVCLAETAYADEVDLQLLGIRPPLPPPGFVKTSESVEVARPSAACASAGGEKVQDLEVTWAFAGADGSTLRAGVYFLEPDFAPASSTSSSRHWPDATGRRYWVAAWDAGDDAATGVWLDGMAASMGGPLGSS